MQAGSSVAFGVGYWGGFLFRTGVRFDPRPGGLDCLSALEIV